MQHPASCPWRPALGGTGRQEGRGYEELFSPRQLHKVPVPELLLQHLKEATKGSTR